MKEALLKAMLAAGLASGTNAEFETMSVEDVASRLAAAHVALDATAAQPVRTISGQDQRGVRGLSQANLPVSVKQAIILAKTITDSNSSALIDAAAHELLANQGLALRALSDDQTLQQLGINPDNPSGSSSEPLLLNPILVKDQIGEFLAVNISPQMSVAALKAKILVIPFACTHTQTRMHACAHACRM